MIVYFTQKDGTTRWFFQELRHGPSGKVEFTITTDRTEARKYGRAEGEKLLRILRESDLNAGSFAR